MSLRISLLVITGILAMVATTASVVAWPWDSHDPEPAEPVVSIVERGRQLFQVRGCAGCHPIAGIDHAFDVGPNLTFLFRDASERVDGLTAEQYVRQSILAPQAAYAPGYGPGFVNMPRISLTMEEVDALTAFLLTERTY